MRPIFISYRRDDTEGQAGRLFQDLREAFGAEAVFMDVATIEPGVDFRRAIEKHTAMCGALLALIGRNWLSAKGSDGRPRLEDPHDFVRLETAAALRRDIPVIPVLVHDAQMVRAEDLPDELKELAFRNGVELTHARWDSDVQLLIKALRPLVEGRINAPAPSAPTAAAATDIAAPPPRPPRKRLAFVAAGLLLGAALIGGGWVVNDRLASERRKAAEAQAAASLALARQAEVEQAAATQAAADKAAADRLAAERAAAEKAAAERAAAQQAAAEHAAGNCISGYVWREARAGDKVCVTPQVRARSADENRLAASTRQPGGGAYGTNTCKQGYVWREAYANDVVCVVPGSRQLAAADNAAASRRVVPAP